MAIVHFTLDTSHADLDGFLPDLNHLRTGSDYFLYTEDDGVTHASARAGCGRELRDLLALYGFEVLTEDDSGPYCENAHKLRLFETIESVDGPASGILQLKVGGYHMKDDILWPKVIETPVEIIAELPGSYRISCDNFWTEHPEHLPNRFVRKGDPAREIRYTQFKATYSEAGLDKNRLATFTTEFLKFVSTGVEFCKEKTSVQIVRETVGHYSLRFPEAFAHANPHLCQQWVPKVGKNPKIEKISTAG